jgi:aryl-alcohol dehydrogenase-like predicted oxidoreductase
MHYACLTSAIPCVSRIGLGGNVFGHYLGESESVNLIHRAREFGINLIDTADTYSNGKSETCIGHAVQGERARWILASKVGVQSTGSPCGIGSNSTIRNRVEGSLRRLRTDYIDIYQLHHRHPVTPMDETLHVLTELVREGKIRCFGVSNFAAEHLRASVDEARRSRSAKPATVQAHLNLLKRSARDELLPYCQQEGIAVLAYGVLARGILSGKYRGGEPLPDNSRAAGSLSIQADLVPEVLATVAALENCAKGIGMPLSRMCTAWSLAQPGVSAVLVGVRGEEQLKENALAADAKLDEGQLHEIEGIVGPDDRFRSIGLGQQIMH